MSDQPIYVTVPGTLERPPMTLHGPVVETLPEDAAIGDLVTFNGKLYTWDGCKWLDERVEL